MATSLKSRVSNLVDYVRQNEANLSLETKQKFVEFLKGVGPRLKEEAQTPQTPSIPDTARLLWVAAGGRPEAFVSYLQTYPDPSLQELKSNPQRLIQVIRELSQEIPSGEPERMEGGTTEAWLPSSNVWGFQYDKKNNRMLVKFNGKDNKDDGPVYAYDNVPQEVARIVVAGGIPAKTKGGNQWGTWWQGKNPSLGASVNALLVKGGFPYQKVG